MDTQAVADFRLRRGGGKAAVRLDKLKQLRAVPPWPRRWKPSARRSHSWKRARQWTRRPWLISGSDAVAARRRCACAKKTKHSSATLDYVQVTMPPLTGKLMNCAMQMEDGTIEKSQMQESGTYRIEHEHGLFVAVQHNSYFVKILWVKWAYFFYDAAYYSLSEFRVIVLHDMATFLIDYVNRAVLWPIGIDPMLKNLAAITGYSYESHLAFFLPKGLKVSAVHKGLKHQMAKSFANGSSQRACGWWFLFLEHGVVVALAHGYEGGFDVCEVCADGGKRDAVDGAQEEADEEEEAASLVSAFCCRAV